MQCNNAIIIFAKKPDINTVKTRLKPSLSDSGRLTLYNNMMNNTIRVAQEVHNAAIFIFFTPNKTGDFFSGFGLTTFPQKGSDLGEKMFNAMEAVLSMGYEKSLLIGTDIPDLNDEILRDAFLKLEQSDVVFGPAEDGGYYLIGMKTINRELFKKILWSTDQVLSLSVKKAEKEGLSISFVKRLRDIDKPEDLQFVKSELFRSID